VKISLDWLRDFVAWPGDAPELAARLTMSGLNVERVEEFAITLPGVVVAHVVDVQRHPEADKLSICQVHDGVRTLTVVCGAPNVRADQRVLLAVPGAELPGGVKIKAARIRGTESHGMICSARELGLGGEGGGIMELPEAARPGTPADALYGFRDQVLDIEVTPNRPDWLSHFGVAREVAALTGAILGAPALWTPPKSGSERLDWAVDIESFTDCPRYTAHLARALCVGPSPDFVRNRLLAIGQRPTNNVVDITNYVMFELGQPLHAFDRAKLSGTRLSVRRAAPGTQFEALDGRNLTLGADHLVIADSAGAVALAGVMGGARSEVDGGTVEVLLESAYFQPLLVRRAARALGLASESSYRFEREADWQMVEKAAQRALHLLQQHAGARIVPDRVDRQNPDREAQPSIPLRIAQVNRLLGTELETTEVVTALQALDLTVVPLGQVRNRKSGSANLMVAIPSFRRDLHVEVDLIEEIARMRGFDNIPVRDAFRGGGGASRRPLDRARERTRGLLSAAGYTEIITSSFIGRDDLDRLALAADDPRRDCLAVRNACQGGDLLLRTTLTPALLRTICRNVNADCDLPVRLFQTHKIFLPSDGRPVGARRDEEALLPRESLRLQFAVCGRQDLLAEGVPADLFEIKGLVASLVEQLGVVIAVEPGADEPWLTEGRQWTLRRRDGSVVGVAGAVAPATLAAYGLDLPVAMAEMALSELSGEASIFSYRPFSRYPAVKRDLSLIVPDGVPYACVGATVRELGGELLESVELFDIYRGKGIDINATALGIRLKFRSAKSNLKGTAVDKSLALITAMLADRHGVRLRA
jgi:phenylalanyl-tRNA synthetase beta chain